MDRFIESKITAAAQDDFDDLCERAKALFEMVIEPTRQKDASTDRRSGRLINAYKCDPSDLVVRLTINADLARLFDDFPEIELESRGTLLALESFARKHGRGGST